METIGQINMVELNGRSAVSHTRVESVAGTGHEGPFDSTRFQLHVAELVGYIQCIKIPTPRHSMGLPCIPTLTDPLGTTLAVLDGSPCG